MKHHKEQYWQISVPDDWLIETEDDCQSVYHPEGAGMLEISAALQQESLTEEDLRAIASEHLETGATAEDTMIGDFSGFEITYDDADVFWREWYLKQGNLLLFITYNCDTGDEEKEEGTLDVILATLKASLQVE